MAKPSESTAVAAPTHLSTGARRSRRGGGAAAGAGCCLSRLMPLGAGVGAPADPPARGEDVPRRPAAPALPASCRRGRADVAEQGEPAHTMQAGGALTAALRAAA